MTVEPTTLQLVWFGLIAVLWIGYLVLEGFDYGVGMLIPYLGRNDKERRVLVNTIGPVWDGNEVWLLTAGGATFAAFPGWYATLFSALYLPLFLILIALIVRGLAFEYRAKRPEQSWKYGWDRGASIGSFVVSLVFGVGFSNFVIGLPVQVADGRQGVHVFTGGFWSLFSPFALLGGVVLVALFLFHGAIFIALKTRGEIHQRAKAFAEKIGLGVIGAGGAWLLWSNLAYGTGVPGWILLVVAAGGLVMAWYMVRADRDGWAFIGTAVSTAVIAIGIFLRMYPDLGFDNSSTMDAPLNIVTASASPLTLTIMTWAAVVFVPIVLGYQAWSYWVFRRRLSTANIPDDSPQREPIP
ncbi:cytochrome d ubiquinol oxidase subunit II [Micropruina sonneratiae]|uniref:cytochrome d ubiquinol oxidase subunit II n=1 Tax=Micropruina sonneratiae TaxID=2986940 RepID=UPI00222685C6|nr:cytochrome d ubiquinol oxidase subunit II [Micropruina sp. KQZ13P-5]MCW3159050.1 cytochrome d ubiquinol oxidase subunit II [Micropruina sp. KQZ13P-5]